MKINLFRGITKTRNYEKLRKTRLGYSIIIELVKEAFENIIDTFLIGVHSLRSGGATAAANAGVHDRMFKGELQRQNKLISSERPFKILQNETKIIKIGQAVLEIFNFKY